MELSKEWYHTELTNSEYDMLHRSPTVEYSFYNAVTVSYTHLTLPTT